MLCCVQVDVLEYYDTVIHSAREAHFLPAVLRVRFFIQKTGGTGPVAVTRRNVMIRDKFTCQCAPQPGKL